MNLYKKARSWFPIDEKREEKDENVTTTGVLHHSGFCVLIGRANVGKSGLANALIEKKVAITTSCPQTTRNVIRGIRTNEDSQLVVVDTPAIHRPQDLLGECMTERAVESMGDGDVIAFVVDGSLSPGPGDAYIARLLADTGLPHLLIPNRIDLYRGSPKGDPACQFADYAELGDFSGIYPVSVQTKAGIDELRKGIIAMLPRGPRYYPEGLATDRRPEFMIRELIRKEVIEHTREEVPHSVAVDLEKVERRDQGTLYIYAVIYVERRSQRGILIGKQGRRLKKIGTLARERIESFASSPVYLDLWVKVKKWRDSPRLLALLGYGEKS